jgi:hypothetical protein
MAGMVGAVTVAVVRSRALAYSVRAFKVVVDGHEVGTVDNGQSIQFTVAAGTHAFKVGVFELKSPELVVDCVPGETIALQCQARAGGFMIELKIVSRNGPTAPAAWPAAVPAPVPAAVAPQVVWPQPQPQPAPAPRPAPRGPHVFISYSRDDAPYVGTLAQHLTYSGLPVWYDYAIVPGHSFSKDIEQAIDACFAFVVVLTPTAVSSDWVRQELSRARRLNKPIWPLYLLPCPPPLEVEGLQAEAVQGGVMPSGRFLQALTQLYRATS